MSTGKKNLWDAALQEVTLNKKNTSNSDNDKYILLMGAKGSGKTTALLKFLARDEAARPTTALEYTFARRTTNLQQTLIAHIWELGGGTNLYKLLDVPLNIQIIQDLTVVLMLDLSQPKKLWFTAETLLKASRQRLADIMRIAGKQSAGFEDELTKKAWRRLGGKKNADKNTDPFPIPLMIVCSKFDLFQSMDADQKQVITQCLRFLAHHNGATLIYISSKIEATIRGWKHVMNAAAFQNDLNTMPVIEASKPLYVPCGMDNMSAIGNPPYVATDVGRGTGKSPSEAWKIAFNGHFPQESDTLQQTQDDPAKDPQFKEPKIDELRAQKDRELEAYKRQENLKWKQN